MRAEILSYSRSRGLFAGVALQGATLRADLDANKALYQQRLTTEEIVRDSEVKPTPEGEKLLLMLSKYAPGGLG
jgi:lipid-binding SYLF domain-containing protein